MTEQAYSHDADMTWLEPCVRCPNCGSVVNGTRTSTALVPLGTPGDTYLGLPRPAADKQGRTMAMRNIHRVGMCGCQVSDAWHEAYHIEIKRRRTKQTPKEVLPMSPEELNKQKTELLKQISSLMGELQLMDTEGSHFATHGRCNVERQLVMLTDKLMRLVPGEHNKLQQVELSADTKSWASKYRYTLPPSPQSHNLIPNKLEQSVALFQKGLLSADTVCKAAGISLPAAQQEVQAEDYKAAGYMQKPVNPSKIVAGTSKLGIPKLSNKYQESDWMFPAVKPPMTKKGAISENAFKSEYQCVPPAVVNDTVQLGDAHVSALSAYLKKMEITPEDFKQSLDAELKHVSKQQDVSDIGQAVDTTKLNKPVGLNQAVVKASTDWQDFDWKAECASVTAKGKSPEAVALAKAVEKNLLDHHSTGAPLTAHTKQYLEAYESITGAPHPSLNHEVNGPSKVVPHGAAYLPAVSVQSKATVLDHLSTRRSRKLSPLKKKGKPEVTEPEEPETDSDDADNQ